MRKINVFNFITLDGYFAGPNGEIDWFKMIPKDDEYQVYTQANAKTGETIIYGRTTYEMMKSYWPTEFAIKNDPVMAEAVNMSPKIVFSKTLESVEEGPNWKNSTLFHDINVEEINKLKAEDGKDMTILGSGSIIQQFSNLGLIDEYAFMVVPFILGAGKSMFKDVKPMNLKLIEERAFKNGIVALNYQAV